MANASRITRGITGHHDDRRIRNDAIRALQSGGDLLIYVVRTKDDLIKIGITSDLVERMLHIKGGSAELLAAKVGTFADEREIHRSLKGHATEGREYYLPTPSVLKVVNTMRASLGMDPVMHQRRWAS